MLRTKIDENVRAGMGSSPNLDSDINKGIGSNKLLFP